MGKYDDVLYDYFTDEERFADFYNGAVFHGRNVVQADTLEDASERYVTEASDVSTTKHLKYKNKYRDVKKRTRNGFDFAIMAIENQSVVDYTMPWRIMQYDQLEYGRQLRKIRERKNQECLKRGEKVARYNIKFSAEDKLRPVYTVCFYHGIEKWNGPTCLADMIDFGECSQAMKDLFHDYKMTLVCVDDLDDLSVFRTDVKLLVQALQLRNNREAMDKLFEREEFRVVSENTVRTIAIMTDYKEFLDYLNKDETKGGINMCQAVEEIRKKYINKGIETGINTLITTCQELNASYEYVVEKLRVKYQLSDAEIEDYMNSCWNNS